MSVSFCTLWFFQVVTCTCPGMCFPYTLTRLVFRHPGHSCHCATIGIVYFLWFSIFTAAPPFPNIKHYLFFHPSLGTLSVTTFFSAARKRPTLAQSWENSPTIRVFGRLAPVALVLGTQVIGCDKAPCGYMELYVIQCHRPVLWHVDEPGIPSPASSSMVWYLHSSCRLLPLASWPE